MPQGDIYEVAIDQTLNEQQISNVHHFIQQTPDGTGLAVNALSAVWATFFEVAFQNVLSIDVLITQRRIRRIAPTETQTDFTTVSVIGNISADPLPPNQVSVLRLYATPSGRKGIGNTRISGTPLSFVEQGRITGSYVALLELYGNSFEVDNTDVSSNYTFRSCVFGSDGVARPIEVAKATTRIKQLRSRTIGQGQ